MRVCDYCKKIGKEIQIKVGHADFCSNFGFVRSSGDFGACSFSGDSSY